MRKSRTLGSVRGAPSNGHPYRDPLSLPRLVGRRQPLPVEAVRWLCPLAAEFMQQEAALEHATDGDYFRFHKAREALFERFMAAAREADGAGSDAR